MSWDAEYAKAHLIELAGAHDIQIVWTDRPEGAYTRHRIAHIRRPATAAFYLRALHEMGHCMSPRARFHEDRASRPRTSRPVEYDDELLCEAAAWAWAGWNIDPDLVEQIPKRAWLDVASCLATYVAHVRDQKIG